MHRDREGLTACGADEDGGLDGKRHSYQVSINIRLLLGKERWLSQGWVETGSEQKSEPSRTFLVLSPGVKLQQTQKKNQGLVELFVLFETESCY